MMKYDYIAKNACTLFNNLSEDNEYYTVKSNIQSSIEMKSNIIKVLEQHENWNASELRTYIDVELSTGFDYDTATNSMLAIRQNFEHSYWDERTNGNWNYTLELAINAMRDYLPQYRMEYFNADITSDQYYSSHDGQVDAEFTFTKRVNRVLELVGKKPIRGNQLKYSKVLNKVYLAIMDHIGYKYPDYDKHFALLSDSLRDRKVLKRAYISVNPMDILLMSFGNSWSSCHCLDGGCYRGGTLCYLHDRTTFIIYGESDTASIRETDRLYKARTFRKVAYLLKDAIMFSRPYGDNFDVFEHELNREVMKALFSDKVYKEIEGEDDHCDDFYYTDGDSCHYDDYSSPSYRTVFSFETYRPNSTRTIGAMARCIVCGSEHTPEDDTSFQCDSCNDMQYCEKCREYHHIDDMVYIDYHGYCCGDCVTMCDDCGDYHLNGDMLEVNVDGRWVDVCPDCLEREFSTCPECGDIVRNDDMTYDEELEDWYCSTCTESIEDQRKEESDLEREGLGDI